MSSKKVSKRKEKRGNVFRIHCDVMSDVTTCKLGDLIYYLGHKLWVRLSIFHFVFEHFLSCSLFKPGC